jgi:O-antigen ligase
MELSRSRKLFYFFPLFFCFCLPFGSLLLSGIVIAWLVSSMFCLDPAQIRTGLKKPLLWLCAAFFLFTALSALLSRNKADALFAVEIRLSFVIFPFLLFCFSYPPGILRRCLSSFVSGCFFACLYLIGRAFIFTLNGQPEYFFYTLFSQFIHASYFAMYLLMAIVFVTLFYREWFREQKAIIYSSWFFIGIFVTGIFLCSSKMGLITSFFCLPVLALYRHRERLKWKGIAAVLAGFVMLVIVAVFLFPASFSRLKSLQGISAEKIDRTSSESTTVRILIWQEAWKIIRGNWMAGVGAGDDNQALYDAYARDGLTGAYSHHLNAHNQYLQTTLALGFPGLLLLLGLTLVQFIQSIRTSHFLLFMFTAVIMLNFLVESMLQTSAGVLFFMFFLCYFNLTREEELRITPAAAQ